MLQWETSTVACVISYCHCGVPSASSSVDCLNQISMTHFPVPVTLPTPSCELTHMMVLRRKHGLVLNCTLLVLMLYRLTSV